MKLTLKIFFLLWVLGISLFGSQNEYFTIKLFSIDTQNNTRTLESLRATKIAANKLSDRLKNRAFIVREGDVFVLYATRAKSKSEALSWLKSYKRYFKDATILKQNKDDIEMIRDYTSTIIVSKPSVKKEVVNKSQTTKQTRKKPIKLEQPYYTLQLASAKLNKSSLNYLKKMVNSLNKELRSKVYITKGSSHYLLQAFKVSKKSDLSKFLQDYKKVFKDAYVLKQDYKNLQIVADYSDAKFKNLLKEIKYSSSSKPATKKVVKKEQKETKDTKTQSINLNKSKSTGFTPTKNAKFTLDLIDDRTFYIVKKAKNGAVMILEVEFHKFAPSTFKIYIDSSKRAKPRTGLIKKYVSEDNKLYLYFTRATMDNTYHVLKEITKDYFIVDVWNKNKKEDTVRFYYDFQKAKEYKDTIQGSLEGMSKYY